EQELLSYVELPKYATLPPFYLRAIIIDLLPHICASHRWLLNIKGTLGGDGGGQALVEDVGVGRESGLGSFLGWSENWALLVLTPCV
ncbi:hypothetical protein B0H65DRAFT_415125, partial [Neurospora tetraspora]